MNSAWFWITRRTIRAQRTGVMIISVVFAVMTAANIAGFRAAYPTLIDRQHLTELIANNPVFRMFYGMPYATTTIGGYAAWRTIGVGSIIAAVWGLFITVGALRGEEETGRWELTLVGLVTRRRALYAVSLAVLAGVSIVWVVTALGALISGPPFGGVSVVGSLGLALAVVMSGMVFAALGALLSQLVPSARSARLLGMAAIGGFLGLRIVADVATSATWLRWVTPFGWAEELRPFGQTRLLILLLPVAVSAGLLIAAGQFANGRDIDRAVFAFKSHHRSNDDLLGSTAAAAFRREIPTLATWLVGTAFFAFVMGLLAKLAAKLIHQSTSVQKLGLTSGTLTTPQGYLSFVFVFFVLASCLVAAAMLGAARKDEAAGTLDMVFSQPVSRQGWLTGQLMIAVLASVALALTAGLGAWAGSATQSGGVGLGDMLKASLNCVPCAILFIGVGVMIFGIAPRLTSALTYGLIGLTFLSELLLPLLKAPSWVIWLSPFSHIAAVPAQSFNGTSAVVMIFIGIVLVGTGRFLFCHRDLVGA